MYSANSTSFWRRVASPSVFSNLADRVLPPLSFLCFLAFSYGIYGSIFSSPADYQQGEAVRILYIHVPAAWLSMFVYVGMAFSALGTLIFRHPLADVAQKAAAPLGAGFTVLCLITGSLWGKPMWGTFWEWDARMTSVLVLLLIYLGIIALWRAMEDDHRAARAVSILTLVGIINLPIIKFSVDWWYTLHQPASVFRLKGSAIDSSMLIPLLAMGLAYLLLYIVLLLLRMKTEIYRRKLARFALMEVEKYNG